MQCCCAAVVLAGWSWGTTLALVYAERHPDEVAAMMSDDCSRPSCPIPRKSVRRERDGRVADAYS
ncbi:alpha/beta fold hydrolase [Mycobacterium pinniadriaticum]|uniref:alpha/beta fold hydrolase n=1 Tax=Mycobacterium pinniadriaticum TaxID=2994102 RepID=UPI0038991FDA